MSDKDELEEFEEPKKGKWGTVGRIYKFGKNIISLESSVSILKEENKQLRGQVRELQTQVAYINGQLEALSSFVVGAIQNQKRD